MTPALFIAGTGTDVGKTHVAAGILREMVSRLGAVEVTKPVMSGVDEHALSTSDAGVLLSAAGRDPTDKAVAAIAPWRFRAPLAPTAAARAEGRRLPYLDVLAFCERRLAPRCDLHLVESAGGIMSPIAENALCLDLASDLARPVVLVAGAYLGAVSHALTAIKAIEGRGLVVAAVVVNENTPDAMRADDVITELAPFAPSVRLFPWRRDQSTADGALVNVIDVRGF